MAKGDAPDVGNSPIIGRKRLHSDLENLVNQRDASDVVFKCGDGKDVYACRWLLVNRCEDLKKMLGNGMRETTQSEISLKEVSSTVMLSIMEYLYTGTIKKYPPCSCIMTFEMIKAAEFFMIPGSAAFAQDFFLRSLARARMNQSVSMKTLLNVVIEIIEPWKGKDEVLQELANAVGFDWFTEDSGKLSRKAAEYLLREFRIRQDKGEKQHCVGEYLMFRNVVLWHVNGVPAAGISGATILLGNNLPGIDSPLISNIMHEIPDASLFLSDPSFRADFTDSTDFTAVLGNLVGRKVSKESLEGLLRYIDFSRIPATLILKIIYPLRVVPPRQLSLALLQSALLQNAALLKLVSRSSDCRNALA